jgi:hypothetical protein
MSGTWPRGIRAQGRGVVEGAAGHLGGTGRAVVGVERAAHGICQPLMARSWRLVPGVAGSTKYSVWKYLPVASDELHHRLG